MIVLIKALSVLFWTILILSALITTIWLIVWKVKARDYPKITWELFMTGYLINPYRYCFDRDMLGGPQVKVTISSGQVQWVAFNLIDTIRFNRWLNKKDKEKENKIILDKQAKVLEVIQKDVQKELAKAKEEETQARKDFSNQLKNLYCL